MCPRALLPIMVQINSIWELAAEAADSGKEEPAEIVFRNVRCLDPATIKSIHIEQFDGLNWEESIKKRRQKVTLDKER